MNELTPEEQVQYEKELEAIERNCSQYHSIQEVENSLMEWVKNTNILTEKEIENRLDTVEQQLKSQEGIDSDDENIDDFINIMRWKLQAFLQRRQNQNMQALGIEDEDENDFIEPPEEEFNKSGGKKKKGKEKSKKKQGKKKKEKKEKKKKSEDIEDSGIREAICNRIGDQLELPPEILQSLDHMTLLAFACHNMETAHRQEVLQNPALCFAFIEKQLKSKALSIPEYQVRDIPEGLNEEDFTPEERIALQYMNDQSFIEEEQKERKIKPDEIILLTRNDEVDDSECPPCLRTLEEKLNNTTYNLKLKSQFQKRTRSTGQGTVIVWARLDSREG